MGIFVTADNQIDRLLITYSGLAAAIISGYRIAQRMNLVEHNERTLVEVLPLHLLASCHL
jgi:hypothetical protein